MYILPEEATCLAVFAAWSRGKIADVIDKRMLFPRHCLLEMDVMVERTEGLREDVWFEEMDRNC